MARAISSSDMRTWICLGCRSIASVSYTHLDVYKRQGYALWEDAFNVSRDTTATDLDIDLGTVDDQPRPRLGTEATDKADGDHMIAPEGKVTVVDEVAYANLVSGKAYTVEGTLMDKATGRPLQIDGAEVTSERDFAPIAPFGTVKMCIRDRCRASPQARPWACPGSPSPTRAS